MAYQVGYNMRGYLPNQDSIITETDTWDVALSCLVELIELWWDQDYQYADDSGALPHSQIYTDIDNCYLNAHTFLHNAVEVPELYLSLEDYSGTDWEFWIISSENSAG